MDFCCKTWCRKEGALEKSASLASRGHYLSKILLHKVALTMENRIKDLTKHEDERKPRDSSARVFKSSCAYKLRSSISLEGRMQQVE